MRQKANIDIDALEARAEARAYERMRQQGVLTDTEADALQRDLSDTAVQKAKEEVSS